MDQQQTLLRRRREHMENVIRTYFAGCNEANEEKISNCFIADAVHYFPPGMYQGPWRGAKKIGQMWVSFVRSKGSRWTIDRLICDPISNQAVMEWSHWKTKEGTVLRGDEWYIFDETTGLIAEIRAYYASPVDPAYQRLELEGLDYQGRGYAMDPPEFEDR